MRCVVGQIEEEGVVLVAVYEADGVVGRYVGVVAHVAVVLIVGDVDKLLVVEPPVGIVVGTVGIGRAYEPAVELVEATVERCGLWVVAVQVPLVDEARAVAGGAEHGGYGGVGGQNVGAAHVGGVAPWVYLYSPDASLRTLVVAYGGVARVLARHERAARGRTDARPGVALGEARAVGRQAVDVWGLYVLATVARQVAVAQVVGQDEDDVRSLWRGLLAGVVGHAVCRRQQCCGSHDSLAQHQYLTFVHNFRYVVLPSLGDGVFLFEQKKIFLKRSHSSIVQSSMLPLVESKFMPTLVTGLPHRAKRWA